MAERNPGRAAALLAGILFLVPMQGTAGRDEPRASASSAAPPAHCCFTNPRYVGTCDVEPASDETCATILEYLNNPQSQGKTYCGSTTIRGAWTAVACPPKTGES